MILILGATLVLLSSIANLVLATLNYRNSRRNAANAATNEAIVLTLRPREYDGAAIERAVRKHHLKTGRSVR